MFPVTQEYLDKVMDIGRVRKLNIKIFHKSGTLTLTEEDLVGNSLVYNEATQNGDNFGIGGIVASDITFEIQRKLEFEDIQFMESRVEIFEELLLEEEIDAHFLQPSQPSKMLGFEDRYFKVNLNTMNIDVVEKKRNSIVLKGLDDMVKLDIPYSKSKLAYPTTLKNIYNDICNLSGIPIGTSTFPNMDYVVSKRPLGDYSMRDIIKFIAQLSGTFARINRLGKLELQWYKSVNHPNITPAYRENLIISDYKVKVSGLIFNDEKINHSVGTLDYPLDLTGNPLLQNNINSTLTNAFHNIKNLEFTPYECVWQGAINIQAGDIVKQVSVDGVELLSPITQLQYRYNGKSKISGKALAKISLDFKNPIDKEISNLENNVNSKFETVDGNISEIVQDINGIELTVTEQGKSIGALTLTSSSLKTQITDLETDVSSEISQLADSISSKVSYTDYNGREIVSLIEQTADSIKLSASKIDLNGITTVNKTLRLGSSTVDRGEIIFANNASIKAVTGDYGYDLEISGSWTRFRSMISLGSNNHVSFGVGTTLDFYGTQLLNFPDTGGGSVGDEIRAYYASNRFWADFDGSNRITIRGRDGFVAGYITLD